MTPLAALAVLAGIVAVATVVGLVWRSRTGRVRPAASLTIHPADVGTSDQFGEQATLLQFSTELCAPCRAASRAFRSLAAEADGLAHVEVDLTSRPDLAARFNILQTPTTFVLDSRGVVRARIGGAPRINEVVERLRQIAGDPHAA